MTTTIPTGRFVWFEYFSKEAQKAQAFYGEVFNWKTQKMPATGGASGDYTMIAIDGDTIGGYPPYMEGMPPHAHWGTHLQVADASKTIALVKSNGGKVLKEPVKMGDFGTWAVVADPFGGMFLLWQPGKPEGTGDFKGKNGAFCWNELMTEQPEKSVAFYKAIGGFEVEAMDMGPMGTYHVLKSEGKPRAGVMKTPKPGIPQSWLPYVQVTSADQTADKAKRLGAQIMAPPSDIPNVGRFAIFTDPLGAALGILQPAPQSK
jgi:predicted enzyme related to lactoylglutathione lyase